ncbi:hypothetical protein ABZX85_44220 [Streptomyces sp. NPDC004539]|uniref:hypothetical protein n=1 Tax=Streptomyces sp. NPDC004539 TaxID=3154280 RepID=UPI0033B8021E
MTHWKWDEWVAHWAGDEDEDLSLVFRQVRVQRTAKTQQSWAKDPLTRAFCNLGAYSLYEHHLNGGLPSADVPELRLFPNMGGEHLMKLAPKVITDDQGLSDSLNRQRFADTWAHHHSYISDLIAYMFRSAPTLRRVRMMAAEFVRAANDLPLGELIRVAAASEIESTLGDPIIALQTFFQAALPRQPQIQESVRRIEQEMINEWAKLYAVILSGYGLTLRPGVTSRDVAELFDTMTEGILLRARSSGIVPKTSIGQDILTSSILLMLPAMCDVPPEELERRRLQQPLEWPV